MNGIKFRFNDRKLFPPTNKKETIRRDRASGNAVAPVTNGGEEELRKLPAAGAEILRLILCSTHTLERLPFAILGHCENDNF
jgi:hypothetical protein